MGEVGDATGAVRIFVGLDKRVLEGWCGDGTVLGERLDSRFETNRAGTFGSVGGSSGATVMRQRDSGWQRPREEGSEGT